ncbi:MAG: NADH-quinone oxidoreductase subunit L [Anaerolineae bacterium]|nr:NADH-quinone oxidoreductase subunit L [Anaerolineae bacterium]
MQGLFSLIPLIVIIPFAGVLINAFFGRLLMPAQSSKAPGVIASIIAGTAFAIAVLMLFALMSHPEGTEVPFLTLLNIEVGKHVLFVPWTFKVDTLSSVMMLVVTGVGTLIHIYAIGYMDYDVDVKAHEWGLSVADTLDLKRRRYSRFFTYLNLFLGSMLILVTGNNYLMMFVGWELVGLCSFLLIGFWYDDPHRQANGVFKGIENAAAAQKAFIANRVGDFGMLLAIFLIFWTFGSLEFGNVFARAECMKESSQAECLTITTTGLPRSDASEEPEDTVKPAAEAAEAESGHEGGEAGIFTTPIELGPGTLPLTAIVTAITLFLLLGATGKSAQIPLFVWLPDAMAGPTPVSALIHAATMVTAGVYMITRSNVLYHMAPFSADFVAYVGAATALVAATIAVAQFDIKKVLAYSTISQLGFMIAAVGLGGYIAGIFHLATHAFFKALLFKGSGSVIQGMERGMLGDFRGGHGHDEQHGHEGHDEHHAHVDPQDMRNMGGMLRKMPLTGWTYIIGALALAGIFPLAGFWSKDEILLDAFKENTVIYIVLSAAAVMTAFYMTRQIFMVFFGKPRTPAAEHASESPATMTAPLVVLASLSVLGGLMNLPFDGFHQLGYWLEHSVQYAHVGSFNITVALISTALAVGAILLGWLVYGRRPSTDPNAADPLAVAGPVFTFLNRKWYVDELYFAVFIQPYHAIGNYLANVVDWNFWHNFVHDSIIAEAFRAWAVILSKPIDQGVVDGAVNGIASLVNGTSREVRRTQTGYVRNYALLVVAGVVAIMVFLVVRFLIS